MGTLEPQAVALRDVAETDLPIFFEHQRDPQACQMVGFASRDWEAFSAHWRKVLANPAAINQTITLGAEVAGNIACWEQEGVRLVGYWLGRQFWGRGVATAALAAFLAQVRERPLYAYVATHNVGSQRVLEKCGFVRCGADELPGEPADDDEEYLLKLG